MKTQKEFNLSEKIRGTFANRIWLEVSDVKEFIERLKEEIPNVPMLKNTGWTHDVIDKLAGSTLTGSEEK